MSTRTCPADVAHVIRFPYVVASCLAGQSNGTAGGEAARNGTASPARIRHAASRWRPAASAAAPAPELDLQLSAADRLSTDLVWT